MDERFDCIIVGAGPSGIAAAYSLANAGLNVVVLERGTKPGAKNMFGGILYTNILKQLIPTFIADGAPVERHLVRRRFSLLSERSELAVDLNFDKFKTPPYNNSFTVLRSRFDPWFADQAEAAGAIIITDAVVDDFLYKDDKIDGVKVRLEGGEIYGDVVICAEGVNSLLAEKAGLKKKPEPKYTVSVAKEVIHLPSEVIDERFGMEDNQGAAFEFFGRAASGAIGSGFIYTDKEHLSVGIGTPVSELVSKDLNTNDLLEAFKAHPCVRNYLRGGKTVEYSAHMIPEGGYNKLGELVADGLILVGDSAGFLNPSLYKEGTNNAMASGVFAAETVLEAREAGDFTKKGLSGYRKRLEESFVLKDLKRYKDVPDILHSHSDLFDDYPDALLTMLRDHFTISEKSKEEIHKDMIKDFKGKVGVWKALLDMYGLRKLFS